MASDISIASDSGGGGKDPTTTATVSGGWSSKVLLCSALPEDIQIHFSRQGGLWKSTCSKGIFSENEESAY